MQICSRVHFWNQTRPDPPSQAKCWPDPTNSWYTMNFVMEYWYTCSVERSKEIFYNSVSSERPTDTAETARPRRGGCLAGCTGFWPRSKSVPLQHRLISAITWLLSTEFGIFVYLAHLCWLNLLGERLGRAWFASFDNCCLQLTYWKNVRLDYTNQNRVYSRYASLATDDNVTKRMMRLRTAQCDGERFSESASGIVLSRYDTGEYWEVTWRDVTQLEWPVRQHLRGFIGRLVFIADQRRPDRYTHISRHTTSARLSARYIYSVKQMQIIRNWFNVVWICPTS